MATVDEIADRIRTALENETALSKTLKVDFKGEGFIFIDGAAVTVEDRPADCTVVVAREDLEAMAKGQLDPMAAMMRGRLKVNGDLSVAMQFQSLLRPRPGGG